MSRAGYQEHILPTVRDPSGMEWQSTRFHHATQNGTQFKTYELFISGTFHNINNNNIQTLINRR